MCKHFQLFSLLWLSPESRGETALVVWFSNCVPLVLCPCIVLLPEQTKLLCCIEINVPVLNGEQKIHFFEAQSWFRHLLSWQIVAAEVWLIPFSLPFFFLLFQESV